MLRKGGKPGDNHWVIKDELTSGICKCNMECVNQELHLTHEDLKYSRKMASDGEAKPSKLKEHQVAFICSTAPKGERVFIPIYKMLIQIRVQTSCACRELHIKPL